jgi:hypothetical protein
MMWVIFKMAKKAYYGMAYAEKIWIGKKSASLQLSPDNAIALAIALMNGVKAKRKALFVSTHFTTSAEGKIVGRAKGKAPTTVTA